MHLSCSERNAVVYSTFKKKIQKLKSDCMTLGQPAFPHGSNTLTSPCLHHAWVFECQLMRAHFKLSCFKNICFSFFSKEFPFCIPTVWFLFQFWWADILRDVLLLPLLRGGDETIGSYLQSLSDKDGFAIKEANGEKQEVRDTGA